MTLPDKLLQKLVCPKCKGTLVYREQESKLECGVCHLAYPVVNDVPVLLVDEAENL